MRAVAHAGGLFGVDAFPVQVEVLLGKGIPSFELVGMPEREVKESRVRVKAALESCAVTLPSRPVVVNLAPGDLRKTGASFDLAIALAIVAAAGGFDAAQLEDCLVLGELGLGGELRAIRGVLPQLRAAKREGITRAIIPHANAAEASLGLGLEIFIADHLDEVIAALRGEGELRSAAKIAVNGRAAPPLWELDLAEIRGQESAKRALEIAAAGGHNLLFVGSPGAGKTMLARRLPSILPPLTDEEAIEVATIHSAAGLPIPAELERMPRPFRAPHSSASASALIGGGDPIRPGEVTLAHRGVLFLDELPEFRRDALESMRQTMEDGVVSIARVNQRVMMPAAPLVIAAMNPCPCGFAGDRKRECAGCPAKAERYKARVSGPLLDRFDMQLGVERIEPRELRAIEPAERSAAIRERVIRARALLSNDVPNDLKALEARAEKSALTLLDRAVERLGLSARAYAKILRVGRSAAALKGSEIVGEREIAEALLYRLFDRIREG